MKCNRFCRLKIERNMSTGVDGQETFHEFRYLLSIYFVLGIISDVENIAETEAPSLLMFSMGKEEIELTN